MSDQRTVTVCASCLRACCWHGVFYCDGARTADLVQKTTTELRALDREPPDYWSSSTMAEVYGEGSAEHLAALREERSTTAVAVEANGSEVA